MLSLPRRGPLLDIDTETYTVPELLQELDIASAQFTPYFPGQVNKYAIIASKPFDLECRQIAILNLEGSPIPTSDRSKLRLHVGFEYY